MNTYTYIFMYICMYIYIYVYIYVYIYIYIFNAIMRSIVVLILAELTFQNRKVCYGDRWSGKKMGGCLLNCPVSIGNPSTVYACNYSIFINNHVYIYRYIQVSMGKPVKFLSGKYMCQSFVKCSSHLKSWQDEWSVSGSYCPLVAWQFALNGMFVDDLPI